MVLVVVSNAWKVFNDRNTSFLQHFRITHARSFEDTRCAICACRDDDHLLGPNGAPGGVSSREEFRIGKILGVGLILDTHSFLALEKDSEYLLLNQDMQVGVLVALQFRVQISMRSILSPSIGPDVLVVTLDSVICIEVLEIVGLRESKLCSCLDECIFGASADVSALADVHVAVVAVSVFVSLAMVFLELMQSQYGSTSSDLTTSPCSRREATRSHSNLASSYLE